MSIKNIENKIAFLLKGSLTDSISQSIPFFSRSSPSTVVSKDAQGNLGVVRIDAYRPAISPREGLIGIEPVGKNELTWNANPSNSSWVKGTNVSVDLTRKPGIDRTFYTNTVTWRAGTISSLQKIRKQLFLQADTDYCLSAIFKLTAGLFRSTDEIRVVGAVQGIASVSLSALNLNPGQQSKLTLSFKTTGGSPAIPVVPEDYLSVQAVQAASINVALAGVSPNQLVGAQVNFAGLSDVFLVTSNTATASGSNMVSLTLLSSTTTASLITLNVTTLSKVRISSPPLQECFLEVESRNDVSMDWGGVQIESKSFPTALIFQQDSLQIRSRTELTYPENPVAGKLNCGLLVDIEDWAGDGNILSSDAISLAIANSNLVATVGGVSIPTSSALPATAKIFVNINRLNNKAYLFVDSILVGIAQLTNYIPASSEMVLTSEGSRNYRSIVFFGDSLTMDFAASLNSSASDEVKELFDARSFGSAAIFRSRRSTLVLPPVLVPGLTQPKEVNITAKDNALDTITVDSVDDIVINKEITISNQNIFILKAKVIGIVGNTLAIDASVEIVNVGYRLRQGETTFGQAIARFPWEPIDVQEIASINPLDNSIILQSSALSFTQGKSIVQDSKDRFVCEPLITQVVPVDRKIFVDSLENLQVGQRISQARTELKIDPANYLATILEANPLIKISTLAQTGVVLSNGSTQATEVTTSISVFL